MADFWKSQKKKFCDFCKCWIADNKPSVGFHESGKRHKENVAKRLAEISKNSTKSYNEELQVDKEMKKMEEEAVKAYMKDLLENPDYTSKRILEETEKRKKELEEFVKQQNEVKEEKELQNPKDPQPVVESSANKVWKEAKSEEGYTYFWNINTAESIWEPPEEGYFTLEEQEQQEKEVNLRKEIKRRKIEEQTKGKQEGTQTSKTKENINKKRKKGKDNKEEAIFPVGPDPKPDPYGAWTVVEPTVEEPLDLELPTQEFIAIKVPELTEPEIKFKEKTVSSIENEGLQYGNFKKDPEGFSESFKKRKFNRGNMRQKLDTD